MEVTLTVKKTMIGYISLFFVNFIITFQLIKDSQKLINVINYLLCNDKVFKMKTDNGKWQRLDISEYEFF